MLALALLFGQAAAVAHAFEHLKGGDADQGHPVCEACVSHAGLGGTLPAAGFALPPDPAATCRPPLAAAPRAGTCQPFARARAPPLSA